MTRAMWRKRLDPNGINAYVAAHRAPWSEMLEDIRRSGMRNYSIFLDGNDAIGYFEHDDLEALDEFRRHPSEVALRWAEMMRPLSADKSPDQGMRAVRREVFYLP